jgi:hypothetical protein
MRSVAYLQYPRIVSQSPDVQAGSRGSSRDEALSAACAQAVANQLRALGVKGPYEVSGNGRDSWTGSRARRVDVVITRQQGSRFCRADLKWWARRIAPW